MKKLILVGGTMGAGKSTVCEALLPMLAPAAYLDGDWCWRMAPFTVTEENRRMVLANIGHLLRSYLHNSSFAAVLFCWVMQEEEIWNAVLREVEGCEFELHKVCLTLNETALRERILKDVAAGKREIEVMERSVQRLPLYGRVSAAKLNVSFMDGEEAARTIAREVQKPFGKFFIENGLTKK
ncbi:AAA family ATPase [Gehongia tenuis]|uniref:AAA family ATPase n=1 Tax=Gehongia tenuis TaxID=2763655 RepID=A0A926HK25_9FIRM|nr:AAA family ATPase [Gehongia tenuis]MBC8530507.1 AAA family ATPase [Gehongia tenuis]